jgi:SpoVK/Ycf46/Vps4 family AAA+-type ATPase/thiol-disulfide isomerase/thioredoxin
LKGGTLFIDEAYQIKPSAKGGSPGPANTILDILLKVSEEERLTTTFILAGYKEEILELLTYNDGFKSRFPILFDFDDYTPKQLKMIFKNMIKEKNFILESKKECGVPIAKISSQRISKGAGKKGFGNARAVRSFVDRAITVNIDRVGSMALHGVKLSKKELSMLSRSDVLGEKPDIENSPLLKDLNKMIGLSRVKEQIRGLMCLQLQNFESENRGEKISEICLHRMFIGNPGTGKTTVAQIYGSLLKEFGLLTKGDVIKVTPSDLMGSAVGSSEEQTKTILKQAEGKVLLIDEAYILDPTRGKGANYGAEVLDTLVSLLDGSAGSDMAVILAGYADEMDSLQRNANPGFRRRFQPEESIIFDDYSDAELQKILLYMVNKNELIIMPNIAKQAIDIISESRRMPKFGNAGTVENFFGRAKVNRSKRIELVSKNRYAAIARGLPIPAEPHPKELFIEDFVNEVTSIEKARASLNGLFNIDHINSLIEEFEVTIKAALIDEIPINQILSDNHMLFLGPPGTGKTTIAKKIGVLFKQLKLLPTDKVTVTSGNDLSGQYVGQTKVKVLELMRQAQGGILFIDEAYSMLPDRSTFSNEVIQALLTNITTEEFSGNLLVIMAGYETEMNNLFKKCNNPGFQSRFDKRRVNFPSWTASQATDVTLKLIEKSNKKITPSAQELLLELYGQLSRLPNWASARDVTENIITKLYVKRNLRLSLEEKVKNRLKADSGEPVVEVVTSHKKKTNRRQQETVEETLPYTSDDVIKAFEATVAARGGSVHRTTVSNNKDTYVNESNGSNNTIGNMANDNNTNDYVNINDIDESDDDFYSEIDIIDSNQKLIDEINDSSVNSSFLIINYKSKTCKSCKNITNSLNTIVDENPDVRIVSVDADKYRDISTKMGIDTVPSCVFYVNGKIVEKLVSGDETLLNNKFTECSRLILKNKSNKNNNPTNEEDDNNLRPQQPNFHFKHTYTVKKNDPNDDKDDSVSKPDVWAALEEACNKLNVSLEELKEMLESKEFSPEIIAMIKSITGCSDTAELIQMLEPQRAPALARVSKLIKEAVKVKSEIEKKKQAKIKSMGRCPMNFEWLRIDGGYQCAGGAHTITDAEVGPV